MKCKICEQKDSRWYILLNNGRCVHCKCEIERRLDTTPLDKKWKKHAEISDKAVSKWLKVHYNQGEYKEF